MFWWKRKQSPSSIPTEIRDELERHGEAAVSAALAQPFDVLTSPLFSLCHEHKEHAVTWLKEKREIAEGRNRLLKRFAIAVAIACTAGLAFWLASRWP